jgi:hypothetical protein
MIAYDGADTRTGTVGKAEGMVDTDETAEPRFRGVLSGRVQESVDVEMLVHSSAFLMQGAFGELSIPFRSVTRVAEEQDGTIALEAGKLKLVIAVRFADRTLLKFLLGRRVADSRLRD